MYMEPSKRYPLPVSWKIVKYPDTENGKISRYRYPDYQKTTKDRCLKMAKLLLLSSIFMYSFFNIYFFFR